MPIEEAFERLADFEAHRHQALRRGIEVARTDDLGRIAPGTSWELRFTYRSRPRLLRARLEGFTPPEGFVLVGRSGGISTRLELELMAQAARRTRMRVGLELRPRTLPARLIVQSLKLRKARLDQKFAARIADLAAELDGRDPEFA